MLSAVLSNACKEAPGDAEVETPMAVQSPVRPDAARTAVPPDAVASDPRPDAAAPDPSPDAAASNPRLDTAASDPRPDAAASDSRPDAAVIGKMDVPAILDMNAVLPRDAAGDATRIEGTVTKAEDERFFWISTPGGLMRFEASGVCGFVKEDDAVLFSSQPSKGCKATVLTHVPTGKPCEVYCI